MLSALVACVSIFGMSVADSQLESIQVGDVVSPTVYETDSPNDDTKTIHDKGPYVIVDTLTEESRETYTILPFKEAEEGSAMLSFQPADHKKMQIIKDAIGHNLHVFHIAFLHDEPSRFNGTCTDVDFVIWENGKKTVNPSATVVRQITTYGSVGDVLNTQMSSALFFVNAKDLAQAEKAVLRFTLPNDEVVQLELNDYHDHLNAALNWDSQGTPKEDFEIKKDYTE